MGDFLLIGKQIDDLPVFAKISDIMIIVGYVVVSVDMFRTNGLCYHLMSYCIQRKVQSQCLALSKLSDLHPYQSHTFADGKLYIILRSHTEISLLKLINI